MSKEVGDGLENTRPVGKGVAAPPQVFGVVSAPDPFAAANGLHHRYADTAANGYGAETILGGTTFNFMYKGYSINAI